MDQTDVELEGGYNRLPQLYNPTVSVGNEPPVVRVLATTTPALGSNPAEARNPNAAMVALAMDWPDALRLALDILTMAQAVRQKLPEGIVVPDRDWTYLTHQRGMN
jgi:hypothetical protein